MNFIIGLPISTNWKDDIYDSILVILDWLTKMIYYEPVNVSIDTFGLRKVILKVIVQHQSLSDLIITDWV